MKKNNSNEKISLLLNDTDVYENFDENEMLSETQKLKKSIAKLHIH